MRGAVPNAVFPLLEINGNSLAGLTAAAGDYHFAERGVERLLPEQLLQREVHAVAPVIAGRGRDVDALPVRMRTAQGRVGRESVLQRKYGEHGRGA